VSQRTGERRKALARDELWRLLGGQDEIGASNEPMMRAA
jgi:hypothetical protein